VRPQVDGKLVAVSFTEAWTCPGLPLAKIVRLPTGRSDQAVAKRRRTGQAASTQLDLERYIRLAATNAVNKQQVDTTRAGRQFGPR
jgi:multidrug efflux system membrane fusion protein